MQRIIAEKGGLDTIFFITNSNEKIEICKMIAGYISAHPYHSQNDETASYSAALYQLENDLLVISASQKNEKLKDKKLQTFKQTFISKDNGKTWNNTPNSIDLSFAKQINKVKSE